MRERDATPIPHVVLSIAGFDPSSGAGVTADLKTVAAHGCFGISVITALTVQNTLEVSAVEAVPARIVAASIHRLAEDFSIRAVKVGMLGNGEVAAAVAGALEELRLPNLVLDPIMWASSGRELLDAEGREVLRRRLLPLARVVTPNRLEAMQLTSMEIKGEDDLEKAAHAIHRLGAEAVVITGGDLQQPDDFLLCTGQRGGMRSLRLRGERVDSRATHGTGCAFSTAIACLLARSSEIEEAVRAAKTYVRRAMETAPPLGRGRGPLNHLWTLK